MAGLRTIETVGDLIERRYAMTAWCPKDGAREVDLAVLAARYGVNASYIRGEGRIRIKCAKCGERNLSFIIRPPR